MSNAIALKPAASQALETLFVAPKRSKTCNQRSPEKNHKYITNTVLQARVEQSI